MRHAHAGGVVDGVGDGGHRRDDGHLAHAADAVGVAGVRHLDDLGVDHGEVEAGGHAVVEEAGVRHGAVLLPHVLLAERPADALDGAALHLPLDVAGVDGGAGVLDGGEAEDIDLARLGVDLDVDDVAGEGGADASRVGAGGGADGAAGAELLASDFLPGDLLVARREDPVLEGDGVGVLGFEEDGGALGHLALHVLGGGDGGDAGREGGAAAAGHARPADGVGIADGGLDLIDGEAERLGGLHGEHGAHPADIDGSGDERDGAVGVNGDGGGGLVAAVEPEAHGDAASAVRTLDGGGEVGVVDDGVLNLDAADGGEGHAVGHAVAFLGGVLEAEVHGLHADLLGELVDDALDGEGGLRGAGGAVGADLGLVDDDIVAIDDEVLDVVGGEGGGGAGADGGAGEGAGLVRHPELGGGDVALAGRADFGADGGGGRGAGRLEDLGAAHGDLHRCAALLREEGGHGVDVDVGLGAEAAADLHGNDGDLALGDAEDGGGLAADAEGALRARPDGDVAIGVPAGCGGVGLDVALVDGAGGELALDDDVGLREALVEVPALELEVAGDVAVDARVVAAGETLGDGASGHGVVEQGGVVTHGIEGVEDDGEGFVDDLDEVQGFLGHVRVGGGDSGNGVALVERLLLGETVLGEEAGVPHGLAEVDHHVLHDGNIGAGDDGLHVGEGLGLARVDGDDAGVAVGAAQDLAVQRAGQVDVGAVLGASGHLVDAVVADGTAADDLVAGLGGAAFLNRSHANASLGVPGRSLPDGSVIAGERRWVTNGPEHGTMPPRCG